MKEKEKKTNTKTLTVPKVNESKQPKRGMLGALKGKIIELVPDPYNLGL